MAQEYPTMSPETNDQAYDIVSQIWSKDGKMTEVQARATFAYLQPTGPQQVNSRRPSPTSFCRSNRQCPLADTGLPVWRPGGQLYFKDLD
ncbi:MAG: hypothetical protein WDN48_12680 [Pseudolabrys sp.]